MKHIEDIIKLGKSEGHDTLPKDDTRFKIYTLALIALEHANENEKEIKKLKEKPKTKSTKPTKKKGK